MSACLNTIGMHDRMTDITINSTCFSLTNRGRQLPSTLHDVHFTCFSLFLLPILSQHHHHQLLHLFFSPFSFTPESVSPTCASPLGRFSLQSRRSSSHRQSPASRNQNGFLFPMSKHCLSSSTHSPSALSEQVTNYTLIFP